ncbi:hypothetical protein SRHO_G00129480 [Serrasalmus rhombeus]
MEVTGTPEYDDLDGRAPVRARCFSVRPLEEEICKRLFRLAAQRLRVIPERRVILSFRSIFLQLRPQTRSLFSSFNSHGSPIDPSPSWIHTAENLAGGAEFLSAEEKCAGIKLL